MMVGCETATMDNRNISLTTWREVKRGGRRRRQRRFPAEIDTPIKWMHTDVSKWPVTTTVNVSFSGDKIQFV